MPGVEKIEDIPLPGRNEKTRKRGWPPYKGGGREEGILRVGRPKILLKKILEIMIDTREGKSEARGGSDPDLEGGSFKKSRTS